MKRFVFAIVLLLGCAVTSDVRACSPAWRNATWPVYSVQTLAGTDHMCTAELGNDAQWASNLWDAWNGVAADEQMRLWSVFGGGHGEWRNPALYIDLNQPTPKCVVVSMGSARSAVIDPATNTAYKPAGPYYLDGGAVSRHSYRSTVFVPGRFVVDGHDRVLTVSDYGAYKTGAETQGYYVAGPEVSGWDVQAGMQDTASTWPNAPYSGAVASGVAIDPRDGKVYYANGTSTNGSRLRVRDPWNGAWSTLFTSPVYPNAGRMQAWEYTPVIVDVNRNKLVTPLKLANTACGGWCLEEVDIASGAVSHIKVTGDINVANSTLDRQMVHDLDNDKYIYLETSGYPVTSAYAYTIDPTTGVSVRLGAIALPKASIDGRAQYVQALGGVVYLPGAVGAMQFIPTR